MKMAWKIFEETIRRGREQVYRGLTGDWWWWWR